MTLVLSLWHAYSNRMILHIVNLDNHFINYFHIKFYGLLVFEIKTQWWTFIAYVYEGLSTLFNQTVSYLALDVMFILSLLLWVHFMKCFTFDAWVFHRLTSRNGVYLFRYFLSLMCIYILCCLLMNNMMYALGTGSTWTAIHPFLM